MAIGENLGLIWGKVQLWFIVLQLLLDIDFVIIVVDVLNEDNIILVFMANDEMLVMQYMNHHS